MSLIVVLLPSAIDDTDGLPTTYRYNNYAPGYFPSCASKDYLQKAGALEDNVISLLAFLAACFLGELQTQGDQD